MPCGPHRPTTAMPRPGARAAPADRRWSCSAARPLVDPPRLARDRRLRPRLRRQRPALRRGDRRAGLACMLKAAERRRASARAWLAIGVGGPLPGAPREIYWTARSSRRPLAALPLARPTSATSPSTRWPRRRSGLLIRARARELDWRLWMDGADRRASAPRRSAPRSSSSSSPTGPAAAPLAVATTLAYPLGDILMLALVVGVVALTRWRPGRTWSLLLLGLGGAGRRRRRLHPADRPTRASRAATGSNRST